mgnify:CR=1 FL=1
MNLTPLEFEILVKIERNRDMKFSQRELAKDLLVSTGMINKTIKDLLVKELIISEETSKYELTLKGYEWLEPYRVKKLFLWQQDLEAEWCQ